MRKLLLVLVTLASTSWAGITYTAVTRTIVDKKNHAADMRVRAWVEGKQVRIDFVESSLSELESGTYLVSTDGGDTSYLVDPKSKTYQRFDINAMVGNMADLMRAMRSQMKVHFEEPKVEKLLDEVGPKMAGLPTHHYRYRTSYKEYLELYETETISTVLEEDIWTTTAIAQPELMALLNKHASSGDEQLDRIIQKEMEKVPGFPLKRITSTHTETNKSTTESLTEMEIVELKTVPVTSSMFKVPKDFTQLDPNDSDLANALKKLEKKKKQDQ